MPKKYEIGLGAHTKLHCFGGLSRFRPGLTDTDSERPVFRIARRTQRPCAGVRPSGGSQRQMSGRASKLEPELELCHLTVRQVYNVPPPTRASRVLQIWLVKLGFPP